MSEEIYDYAPDAVSQLCYAELEGGFGPWEVGEHIEDVDGKEAVRAIQEALDDDMIPVVVDGFVMGFTDDAGNSFIYTDCDEETYEEMYGEPYQR